MAKKIFYIYRITNLINDKTYIGQHRYSENEPFDRYLGSGILIQKAIKKYGKENFKKEILYNNIQYQDTANSVEKFAIAKERSIGKAEYNIADGGYSSKGFHFTDEQKKLMSIKQKGKKLSEEHKKHISESNKGRKVSEETRKKISEKNKGNQHFKGHIPWNKGDHSCNKGRKASEETRKRLSESHKGKHPSDETRKKLSEASKRVVHKPLSEETKRKLSEAHKGKTPRLGTHQSEETKCRISETKKGKSAWNKGLKCVIDENGKRKYIKGDK